MIGFGVLAALFGALILFLTRKGRAPTSKWFAGWRSGPRIAMTSRQRLRLDLHRDGPPALDRLRADDHAQRRLAGVSALEAWISIITLTLLYAVLAVVEIGLILRFAKAAPTRSAEPPDPSRDSDDEDRPLRSRTERGGSHGALHRLVHPDRRPLDRLLHPRGVRLRRRHAAADPPPRTTSSAGSRSTPSARSGTATRSGPHRRRRDVRGVPGVVRHALQRVLPCPALILLALIVRGLAFEYRHQRPEANWHGLVGTARSSSASYAGPAVGVAFANIVRGVPIDADKEFTGNLFTLLNPFGLPGGVVTLLLFLTHGAMFLALKTDGDLRVRSQALASTGSRRRRPSPRWSSGWA